MKKILYIVLDGLGDLPIKELGKKTPLEAANTPRLDTLAQKAKLGKVYPVARGIAPESDIAVISLLGLDAHTHYTGRGPLESFAEGLMVHKGDLALRVNFATVKEDGKTIEDRRVGRNLSAEETEALSKEINSQVILSSATFDFKATIGHRGVLVIRCIRNRLSGWITNTDPAYERRGLLGIAKKKPGKALLESRPMSGHEKSLHAKEAAKLLNEFTQKSHSVLNQSAVNKQRISDGHLPANIILSRDAGDHLSQFPSLQETHGLSFGSFVEMPVERGIALLAGMAVINVPSRTGDLDIDYGVWAKLALEGLHKFDCLYVHIKGPDEAAHDGDFIKKKEIIEAIDAFFFAKLLPALDMDDTVVAVTADHTTVSRLRAHTADPVPLLVYVQGIQGDRASGFSERQAKRGSLKSITGRKLMDLFKKYAAST
ncbi:alkaline phosphatase family protein [Candidatus Omnitrophota bacterium]